MSLPLESAIERFLVRRVREAGGLVRKLQWIGHRHAPDRLVGLHGRHYLVELKRPRGAVRAGQLREHKRLRAMGFVVLVLDTHAKVDHFVARCQA